MPERILVTGAGGYVSAALVPHLIARGDRVTALDLFLYGEDVLADVWTPLSEFGDPVDPFWAFAALDCPTGWGAVPLNNVPHVLARLTANPSIAPIRPGEPHVVTGWLISEDGRKRTGGAAIHTADGELCAVAEGLWIAIREPGSHGATR